MNSENNKSTPKADEPHELFNAKSFDTKLRSSLEMFKDEYMINPEIFTLIGKSICSQVKYGKSINKADWITLLDIMDRTATKENNDARYIANAYELTRVEYHDTIRQYLASTEPLNPLKLCLDLLKMIARVDYVSVKADIDDFTARFFKDVF